MTIENPCLAELSASCLTDAEEAVGKGDNSARLSELCQRMQKLAGKAGIVDEMGARIRARVLTARHVKEVSP